MGQHIVTTLLMSRLLRGLSRGRDNQLTFVRRSEDTSLPLGWITCPYVDAEEIFLSRSKGD